MNSARQIQIKGHFVFKVFIVVCLCFVFYAGIANNFTISTSNLHNDKVQLVNPNLQNDQVHFVNRNLQSDNAQVRNILDGCYHVYIDVGTNVGIQIRKLLSLKNIQTQMFTKCSILNLEASKSDFGQLLMEEIWCAQ